MKRSIWRGAVVAAAVGALIVGVVPAASAAPLDPDPPFTVDISNVNTYRIAGNTRIQTAIKASQSRTWGNDAGFEFDCDADNSIYEGFVAAVPPYVPGQTYGFFDFFAGGQVLCTVVPSLNNRVDIILARDDDFADALAAAPLADVLTAPILINPTDELNDDVRDEIARLAGQNGYAVVHLLGGTNALSQDVKDAVEAIPGVANTWRYQGVNRYQTAVTIGGVTIGVYTSTGLDLEDVNVYLTTGLKFPDALSAGAAAANNDGVVLLTAGDEFDSNPSNFSFTYDALTVLDGWVPGWDENNAEIFAVGGPAVRAANGAGVNLADSYDGVDRYETATLTAEATFETPFGTHNYFAVASGENYPDAVVAAGYIANADGPLLLTRNTFLSPVTEAYLQDNAQSNDTVFVFGGTGSVNQDVQDEIDAAVDF